MAYINEQELQNLRSNADIIEIVSSYIPLTLKGKNYFGVCPFHEDHSPSMSVSKEKQMFKCFSCGAAGNVFTFVERYENVSFGEAINIIANKIGYNLSTNVVVQKNEKYPRDYEMMDIALKFYQNNLNTESGSAAKKYLIDRGLKEKDIIDFDIGLALSNNLYKLLEKKEYEIKEMEKVGLVSTTNNTHDIFYNRIMFPIHNLDGKVVAFTGRVFDGNGTPKYLGSRENNIYRKSNILFNYHRARESIKLEKKVIIVEGNMDAIRLYINNIKNVVALMGTALTKEQIDIIKKLRCKVILMLDNDVAGEKATYDNGLLLEKSGIETLVVRLTGEKDPDEYVINNGAEAMLTNIKKAYSFNDFKLNYLKKDKNLSNTEDLVKYVKTVIDDLNNSKDEILKEVTIKKLSEEYNLSYDVLKKQLEESNTPQVYEEIKLVEKKKSNSYTEAVNNVLYYMMNDQKYIKIYMKQLGFFDEQVYRMISSEIMYYYELNKTINIADFITYANNSKLKDNIMEIIANINYEDLQNQVFLDSIELIKKKRKERRIKDIKLKLKSSMDEVEKERLLQEMIELKKEV